MCVVVVSIHIGLTFNSSAVKVWTLNKAGEPTCMCGLLQLKHNL